MGKSVGLTAQDILRSCGVSPEALESVEKTASSNHEEAKVSFGQTEKLAAELENAANFLEKHGVAISKTAAADLVEKTAEIDIIAATLREIDMFATKVVPSVEKTASMVVEAMQEGYTPAQIAAHLQTMGKEEA